MSNELTPPDEKRCQAENVIATPFALGGTHRTERCDNAPAYIATENKPGEDGLIGSMSLCPECAKAMTEKFGKNFATFKPIKAKP